MSGELVTKTHFLHWSVVALGSKTGRLLGRFSINPTPSARAREITGLNRILLLELTLERILELIALDDLHLGVEEQEDIVLNILVVVTDSCGIDFTKASSQCVVGRK